jgi:2-oxo-3-hexenedioate decarboxylase
MNEDDLIDLGAVATRLDEAARTARATPQLTEPLTLEDAYLVQKMSLGLRYARGERRAGIKMGFTSRAKMVQMGVHDMIWGRLTDAMRLEENTEVSRARYVHARVEPEIAFLIGKTLPEQVSLMEAQASVEAVAPAIELIDSRYENFKFSLTDVVADNSSSSGFVIGGWASPDTDVSNLGMILSTDGAPQEIGSSAAILGNPWRSLVAAARVAAIAGEPLQPGDIVLAGGATAAIALAGRRHVRLETQGLGRIDMFVGD